jgi:hypothetical protein
MHAPLEALSSAELAIESQGNQQQPFTATSAEPGGREDGIFRQLYC